MKNIDFLSGGTFGITGSYLDIVIKFLRIDADNRRAFGVLMNELVLLKTIAGRPDIPETINKYYGLLTGKRDIIVGYPDMLELIHKSPMGTRLGTSIYTDLGALFDYDSFLNSYVNSDGQYVFKTVPRLLTGSIAAVILKREDGDVHGFIQTFMQHMNSTEKMTICILFIKNVLKSYNFLHHIAGYIHYDIKSANILYRLPSTKNHTLKFIVTDF